MPAVREEAMDCEELMEEIRCGFEGTVDYPMLRVHHMICVLRVSVVRSRSDQLSIHGTDAGSATLSEFRTFPVGGVVTSLVEDVSEAI